MTLHQFQPFSSPYAQLYQKKELLVFPPSFSPCGEVYLASLLNFLPSSSSCVEICLVNLPQIQPFVFLYPVSYQRILLEFLPSFPCAELYQRILLDSLPFFSLSIEICLVTLYHFQPFSSPYAGLYQERILLAFLPSSFSLFVPFCLEHLQGFLPIYSYDVIFQAIL